VERSAGAATQRWRLLIAYDGAAFRGFAVQPEVPTVAGALRQALERTARLGDPPVLTCAGRTDAGVHARGQVVHVDLPAIPYDGPGLARALNRQLAPQVVVRRAEEVEPGFDARRSASGRTYRYLVWNAPAPDPLLAPVAWHVRDTLDLRSMRTASDVLLGTHDFRSFCRRRPGTDASEPIVRRVTRARWSVDEGPEAVDAREGAGEARLLRFEIAAGAFCHQMVRSLVASLVEVGRGRENAAGLVQRLRAATRLHMADPAPAHGLCLISVAYEVTEHSEAEPSEAEPSEVTEPSEGDEGGGQGSPAA
jgi:tRNA pseudouridine38-40 synthase